MKSTGINRKINSVIPAQAGIQLTVKIFVKSALDSRLRGKDNRGEAE